MRNGKGEWSSRTPADKIQAVADIFALLSEKQLKVRLYGSVIEKSLLPIDEILPHSFENLASEFDSFLAHQYTQYGQAQRGIVILDKSHYEHQIQGLSYLFKHVGHSTGKLRNFAEVPLFLVTWWRARQASAARISANAALAYLEVRSKTRKDASSPSWVGSTA
jgi:hypothetical protein